MQFFDGWHIMWIFIYFGGTVGLCIWLKSKNKCFQQKFIYGMIVLNFILHFVGPVWVHDERQDQIFRMTMINTCAVLVFLSPFLYWQRDRFLKPGWLYMCVIGALGMIGFPEYAIGHDPFSFDILRLFIQHALLLFVPVLLVVLGHEELRFRDVWAAGVFYVLILIIVVANDAVLETLGFVHHMRWWNGAFQWHPGTLHGVVNPVIPDAWMRVPFGVNVGAFAYWPIIYMLPVIVLLILPVSVGITWVLSLGKKRGT